MASISEEDIRGTAEALIRANDYQGFEFREGTFLISASYVANPGNAPSVQEAFQALEALPSDHPLRKEIDFTKVRGGYAKLKSLNFDPSRNYTELGVHLRVPT